MAEPRQRRRWLRVVGLGAGAILAGGAAAGTAAGLAGEWHWGLELFSHFPVQYALGAALGAAALLAIGARRWALVAAVVMVFDVARAGALSCGSPAPVAADGPRIRIVSFNANHANEAHERVGRWLGKARPDIIVLLEATPELARVATAALPAYRVIDHAAPGPFGIVVLSRLPVMRSRLRTPVSERQPSLEVILRLGEHELALLALHPPPPISALLAAQRDAALADAADWARQRTGLRVVAGDFNATPWSPVFRNAVSRSGLIDSTRGFGIQPTFPRAPWPLAIPIDHLLHSPDLTVLSRATGPYLGSDHRLLDVILGPARDD